VRCRNCGYEAGFFSLKYGLCKSCRTIDSKQDKSNTKKTAENSDGRGFSCKKCGYEAGFLNLLDGLCKACRKKDTKDNFRHKREQSETKQEGTSKVLSCPSCSQKIRVEASNYSKIFRCVTCQSHFSVRVDKKGHLHVNLEYEKRTVSEGTLSSVEDCFLILDLPIGASKQEVKKAYRRKMMEYHPDKMVGLGSKLKSLAESESKKINGAKSILVKNGYM